MHCADGVASSGPACPRRSGRSPRERNPTARSNVIAIVPPSWSTEYSRSPSTPTASPLVAPLTATKSCRHASDVGGSIHRLRTSKRFDRSSRANAAPL